MTWVKICGVCDAATAEHVTALKPDAIGLNFYERSARFVTRETAAAIVDAVSGRADTVGVFVNATPQDVAATAMACRLNRIQLHGDETPEMLAEIQRLAPQVSLIRAWRRDSRGLEPLADYLQRCVKLAITPAAVLIDASVAGAFGGTGVVLPWNEVRRECATLPLPPVILAGGLTADNVAAAIAAVHPWGVDVASGVESSAGVKDLDAVRRFIANARETSERGASAP